MVKKILVVNGPNLNYLGRRAPELYGAVTLVEIVTDLQRLAGVKGYSIQALQSNHEGVLIDRIQAVIDFQWAGIIINPGGLTHTSVSLRDAISLAGELGVPTIEIHISNIYKRETFRRVSLIKDVCVSSVVGKGPAGYAIALEELLQHLEKKA